MKESPLSKKQLSELIFPAFAYKNPLFPFKNEKSKYSYSAIPLDFYSLISDYLKLYESSDDLDDISLIVNAEEYLNNPEYWLDQFISEMNNSFNELKNKCEIDFKYGYAYIKYKATDLSFLNNLSPNTLQQLVDMKNWILTEKERRIVISEFKPTEISVKPYTHKKIIKSSN